LYFVNVLLFFLTFEGERGDAFFSFLKKNNLEGGGAGVFFLHFLLLFYHLNFFVTFCLFSKGKGEVGMGFIFLPFCYFCIVC
jgi:hypothetical protein